MIYEFLGGVLMASVFLSPSTQEYNITTTGNSEEYYANLITDAMIPYLNASNISYGRNDPDGNVNTSIAMSNAGNYDIPMRRRNIFPGC